VTGARRASRKQARRDAAFVLYQRELTGSPVESLLADRAHSEDYAPDEFTERTVRGVLASLPGLDAELDAHSTQWPLSRIAPLERSILRLALHEIDSGETPPEVAIDEAVRLAKRYSTNEAGSLVNGILGAIARDRAGASGDVTGEETGEEIA
jgi:N utilization substance protein B